MGEPIYVSLDDRSVQDGARVVPTKEFGEEVLGYSFRELIDGMVDLNPRTDNDNGYNLDEKKVIERFRISYENALNQPNSIINIYAKNINTNVEKGPFNLDSKVGDYTNDILNSDVIEKDGSEIRYRSIDLVVNTKGGGAIDSYLY